MFMFYSSSNWATISAITSSYGVKFCSMNPLFKFTFPNELEVCDFICILCKVMHAKKIRQQSSGDLSLKHFKQGNFDFRIPIEHSTICRVLLCLRRYLLWPSCGRSEGIFGVSNQLKFPYPLSPKRIAFSNGRQPIQCSIKWNEIKWHE